MFIFQLYDRYGRILVKGTYDIANTAPSQRFPVTNKYWSQFKYKFVTLKIFDNHGLPDYTCLYGLRIYGEPSSR
jgi:hypothetical protein